MAYSTKEDVREILQGLPEQNSSPNYDVVPSGLSDAQIEYEISNADSQIDLVLRKRGYSTPLPDPIPTVIHTLSVDIAVAYCDLIFRGSREYTNTSSSPFQIRYNRAMQILRMMADGSYPIYNPGEGPETAEVFDSVVINPYPGDVLLTKDVFPRGADFLHSDAEYSTRPYDSDRYGRGR